MVTELHPGLLESDLLGFPFSFFTQFPPPQTPPPRPPVPQSATTPQANPAEERKDRTADERGEDLWEGDGHIMDPHDGSCLG